MVLEWYKGPASSSINKVWKFQFHSLVVERKKFVHLSPENPSISLVQTRAPFKAKTEEKQERIQEKMKGILVRIESEKFECSRVRKGRKIMENSRGTIRPSQGQRTGDFPRPVSILESKVRARILPDFRLEFPKFDFH